MKQAHVLISGFVQGVGFRQFVKREAIKLGLTGWVGNTKDNKVEAVFQPSAGSGREGEEKIKEMIELCKKGPFLAEVEDIKIEWEETKQEYESFKVQR